MGESDGHRTRHAEHDRAATNAMMFAGGLLFLAALAMLWITQSPKEEEEQSGSRSLTAHGTLYKALGRLEEFGLLSSHWEDAETAEGRPRRRLYELTGQGARVAEQALADKAGQALGRPLRIAPEGV